MEKVRKKIKFDEICVVELAGKADGLAAFWNNNGVVKDMVASTFTIDVLLEENGINWWCIGIYASTDDKVSKEQWKVLNRRKIHWGQKWMIIGDFNDITSNEKNGKED